MLPEKRKGNDEGGGGGSFEVRVIGGGIPSSAEAGGSKGVEIGLRIGGGEAKERAAVPAGTDAVFRLEPVAGDEPEPLPARPMSEVGPAVPRVSRSSRKRRVGLAHWTGWMAAASCALIVAAVAGLMVSRKPKAVDSERKAAPVAEKRQELDPEQKYFLEHSAELIAEAESMLARYAAASSLDQVLPLVRDVERVKPMMTGLWQPWGDGPAFASGQELSGFVLEGAGRPAICLTGAKGDFSRFEMVFVREGERLKLDWEASHGIGDARIADLQEGASFTGGLLRVVIRPETFYTADFPESGFQSYQLLDTTGDHSVWGFAPRGSAVARALDEEFNEGSVLLEKNGEIRATVRLAEAPASSRKCFEIAEMLHKGWVTP